MSEQIPAINDGKIEGDAKDLIEPKVVSIDELNRVKSKNQELLGELKKRKEADAIRIEQELKAKEDFKKLAETREEQLKAITAELEQKKLEELNRKRYISLSKALNSPIEEKYLPLIDFDKVIVDEFGKIDEFSLTKYAGELKQNYGAIFTESKNIKMPNNHPQTNTAKITYEEWLKLPAKEMAEKAKDIL
jgi:phenylalanyl-tRNA synthetase alpha subunit